MKINLDPLPNLRLAAEDKINQHFNEISKTFLHRDKAHASKRAIAESVVNGGASTDEFVEEATLRGLSPLDLAKLILSKPDTLAARELQRQKLMIAIQSAGTPEALDALTTTVPR